jgi:hypothetical protein
LTGWAERRLAELHAAAPKRKRRVRSYAKVPLELAARAAAAIGDRRLFVWIWLLHRTWQRGSLTVVVSSAALRKFGVSRDVKRHVLKQLEAAGLIQVEWRPHRNPVVTVIKD